LHELLLSHLATFSPKGVTALRVLNLLAEVFAILAGLLLTTITLMTCVSLIGRNFFETTLAGDFELTGVAAGAAIALFMPYCQATRANIIVDFFTATLKGSQQARLDRLGALMVALMFALLTWRTVLGGLNSYNTHSETQILGFPEWTVYATMVPAFVLTSLIGLAQSLWAVSSPEQGAPT
jgi:TRAP-type C4-dicarboxylate transport system permease small subunit